MTVLTTLIRYAIGSFSTDTKELSRKVYVILYLTLNLIIIYRQPLELTFYQKPCIWRTEL